MSFRKMQDMLYNLGTTNIWEEEQGGTLLWIRIICFICPWDTLLLIQPKTTRALGCRDGLYWNANLQWKDPKSLWKPLCLLIINNKNIDYAVFSIFSTIWILLQLLFNLGHTFELVLSTGPATCMLEYLSYMP